MIDSVCTCGHPVTLPEAKAPGTLPCPACGATLHYVTAESLAPGTGAGDFDACLVVERGPHNDRVGHLYLLGGVPPITVGKLSTSHILLPGTNVSRHHATLTRLDFGPSRWQIEDCHSTNGLWINDQRVSVPHELQDNDLVVIGEYELRFRHAPTPVPDPTPPAAAGKPVPKSITRPTCPSCNCTLPHNSRICVDCGIDLATGRTILTSRGFDEDDFAIRADTWIRIVSWFIPLGLYPVASEAMGLRKPFVTWAIATLTILASLWFFVAHDSVAGAKNLMLWSGDPAAGTRISKAIDREIEESGETLSPRERKTIEALREKLEREERDGAGEFRPYQFLTHALLHADLLHLAGNLLFLFVLGSRVNALIGNLQSAIVYPVLAVAAGVIHHLAMSHQPHGAALGASGAIMGLAGMYLVLFPVNKVYMAAWFRLGPFLLLIPILLIALFKLFLFKAYWVFRVPGVFVVLFFIAFDVWDIARGNDDGVAHWAHLGGFLAGVTLATLLLVTRLANARGGDLLSVLLGRHAWKLLGTPASRALPTPSPVLTATPLNYPD